MLRTTIRRYVAGLRLPGIGNVNCQCRRGVAGGMLRRSLCLGRRRGSQRQTRSRGTGKLPWSRWVETSKTGSDPDRCGSEHESVKHRGRWIGRTCRHGCCWVRRHDGRRSKPMHSSVPDNRRKSVRKAHCIADRRSARLPCRWPERHQEPVQGHGNGSVRFVLRQIRQRFGEEPKREWLLTVSVCR